MPYLRALLAGALTYCTSSTPDSDLEEALRIARELHARGSQVVEVDDGADGFAEALPEVAQNSGNLPIVMMHGMGDFAQNPMGMVKLRDIAAKEAKTYVHSVELCSSPKKLSGCVPDDQLNGFLMSMDHQVDQFARVVRGDPKLAGGFNAIGMSQGNNIIRGYVHRYNDPPVKSFVSLHGPMMGVAGIPRCPMDMPGLSAVCKAVDELLGLGIYTEFVQEHLAQSNYFRDPKDLESYREHCHFLPDINNEIPGKTNATYAENFKSLNKLVLVMARDDMMVQPKESEHFGFFADGSMSKVVSMQDAPWYTSFGLQELAEAGKIDQHETPGDHLQFTTEFFVEMVRKYFSAEVQIQI